MKRLIAIVLSTTAATALCAAHPGAYLGDLTWPVAEQRFKQVPLVILPFAAGAKEHGPHLAMNADRTLMEYLCQRAVEAQTVLVAPPILYGWFPAFRQFPGTEVRDVSVFQDYVLEVARSLARSGAQRIVFLNTGVTRATGLPIAIVAREIRAELGVPTLVISWDDLETDEVAAFQRQTVGGHADEIETAINLVLNPNAVDLGKARRDDGSTSPSYPGYRPGIFSRDPGDPGYSQTGIRGDPTLATHETGEKALAIMTDNWLRALAGFSTEALIDHRHSGD